MVVFTPVGLASVAVAIATAAAVGRSLLSPRIPLLDISSLMANQPNRRLERALGYAILCALRTLKKLHNAAADLGVFRVIGHGVEIGALLNASRTFFSLPDEIKQATRDAQADQGGFTRGYIPVGGESGLASFLELKEGFCYGWPWEQTNSTTSNPIASPNCWPSMEPRLFQEQSKSADVPKWQEVLLNYFHESLTISTKLSLALADAHRGPVTSAELKALLEGGETYSLMRLFHYLSADRLPEVGKGRNRTGSSPHTDWHVLTVILQDSTGGLQVRSKHGKWLDVPAKCDELIILVGDYMSALSGGTYHAPVHRVLLPANGLERYSYTLFHYPRFDAKVPIDASRRASKHRQSKTQDVAFNTLLPAGEELTYLSEQTFGDLLQAKWLDVASNRA